MHSQSFRVIGWNTPKVYALDKVTGKARFGADVKLPRMLAGKGLRSPYAHARIKRIDTTKAETMPGVMAIVTGKDLPVIAPGDQSPHGNITARGHYLSQEVTAMRLQPSPPHLLTWWRRLLASLMSSTRCFPTF